MILYKNEREIDGVVAEYKGKYWGTQYTDGRITAKDFGPIENAEVADSKYVVKPTDFTSQFNTTEIQMLKKCKLVKVKKTIITLIEI